MPLSPFSQCLTVDWYAASRRPRDPLPLVLVHPSKSNSSIYIWVCMYINIYGVHLVHVEISVVVSKAATNSSRSRNRVLNEILSAHSKMYYTLIPNGYYDFIVCNDNDIKICISTKIFRATHSLLFTTHFTPIITTVY